MNARLKAAIQRRAADFESVVVDSLDAIPYLPLGISGRTVFFVQRIESDSPALAKGLLGSRRVKRIRRYEHGFISLVLNLPRGWVDEAEGYITAVAPEG